jgi:hypothetical protein
MLAGGDCSSFCSASNWEYATEIYGPSVTFTFDNPKNAFGTTIFDIGTTGQVTWTLMTDDGQEYTAAMSGGDDRCNERFFGVISDMNFTMAIFTSDNEEDSIYFDDTYCANVAPIPTLGQWGIIALSMIMLILGLVVVRQRKLIFA